MEFVMEPTTNAEGSVFPTMPLPPKPWISTLDMSPWKPYARKSAMLGRDRGSQAPTIQVTISC